MNEDNTQNRPSHEVPPAEGAEAAGQTTDPIAESTVAPGADAAVPAPESNAVAAAPARGHEIPPTFASPAARSASAVTTPDADAAPVPPVFAQPGAAPAYGVPAQQTPTATAPGAAFGIHTAATQAQTPLFPGAAGPFGPEGQGATKDKEQKRGGAKLAAIVVAAALVGGVAGFGGSALWNGLTSQSPSGVAEGPRTVTVNNPGSVNETTAVATAALPSVVTIQVAGSSEAGSGSGVIISADGYVLTNTHVVTLGGAAANPTIRVTTSDGRIYPATIVGTDPVYDLAVVRLEGATGLTPMEFADSSNLNVGDTAVALGAPLGLSNSVTTGVISALNRSIQIASSAVPDSSAQDQQTPQDGQGSPFRFDLPGDRPQPSASISIAVIQTDAAINQGNSGGALVDSRGQLIGINVAIASSGGSESAGSIGIGFAIPSNVAQRVAQELIANGAATHGLLGASVRDAAAVEGTTQAGAYIAEVPAGGAAAAAGLQVGDVVTAFNGVPITNASDLTAQVRAAAAGSVGQLTYVRGDSQYDIEVTLGALGG